MQELTKTAFVTGGSSGIGLSAALRLASICGRVALFARERGRLEAAAETIRQRVPGADVGVWAVDVANAEAVTIAVAEAIAAIGVPSHVVLSAGICTPGRCDTVPVADHRRGMEVNYFGVLNMVLALSGKMARGGGIGIVGSAASLAGTYGHGAYAPSKFAVHGLAEILRTELAPRGIGVTLCLPPDTDTPMLEAERLMRPAVTSHMARTGGVLSADAVARALIAGMEAGQFLVLPGLAAKLLYLFGPWIAPFLRLRQARLVEKLGE